MSTLRFLLRYPWIVCLCAWVAVVWAFDAAREHAKKRRLGAYYEGPLDNLDLR